MKQITIRNATPSDSEFAYQVRRAAFKEYVEQVGGWDETEQHRLHDQRFAMQDFRIISLDGMDIGILALDVKEDCIKVNQLFLLPEYQGQGHGRRCMARIMEDARWQGLPVRLRVLQVNPRALTFYWRLGFTQIDETETHLLLEWESRFWT